MSRDDMTNNTITVHIDCVWDDDARVWIATSPDVAGLVLEDGSFDRLAYRIGEAVPELIELNNQKQTSEILLHAEKKQYLGA